MKKRNETLDFLRTVSMFAVIMIHVSGIYSGMDSRVSVYGMSFAYILNQISRFSVPMFILLSGLSLRLYPPADLKTFYIRRARKIAVPYVIWSAVYLLSNNGFFISGIFSVSFLRMLLTGGAAVHLYFIVVLAQFYILYPFIIQWAETSPAALLLFSWLLTCLSHECLFFQRQGLDVLPLPIVRVFWLLIPAWLLYFSFGLLLTEDLFSRVKHFAEKNTPLVLAGGTAAAFSSTLLGRETGQGIYSLRIGLSGYILMAFLGMLAVWPMVSRFHAVRVMTAFLARHSLTVYFGHYLVMRRMYDGNPYLFRGSPGMILLYICTAAVSVFLAFLIDSAVRASSVGILAWKRQT